MRRNAIQQFYIDYHNNNHLFPDPALSLKALVSLIDRPRLPTYYYLRPPHMQINNIHRQHVQKTPHQT